MRSLRSALDRVGPAVHSGRLRYLAPAFDALDAFLYSVAGRAETAPHIRGPNNVKRYMSAVIVALMPCIAAGVFLFGWRVAAMIAVTYVVGLSIEWLFAILRGEEINEGFFVTGLLYPLILPPHTPMWVVGVGIAFGVVVGKELFGGTGRNPFNPALVGRCFLLIGYPAVLTGGWAEPARELPGGFARWVMPSFDAATQATPLAAARSGQFADLWDLFLGFRSGSVGETSSLLILLAGAFLVVTGVVSWRTIAGLLGSFAALLGVLAWAVPDTFGRAGWGPLAVVGWHILAGGLLFGAIFMATDPISGAVTNLGKWLYGILIGVSTVFIRHLTGLVEGIMFAILLGNIAAPLMDELAKWLYLRRMRHEG